MANIERLRQVLTLIKENPQHWNQEGWRCGTSHCFAGFADCLANGVDFRKTTIDVIEYNYRTDFSFGGKTCVEIAAREWLDLSKSQGLTLFDSQNTLKDLERIINKIELGIL